MSEPAGRIVSGDCVLTYIVSAQVWYAYAYLDHVRPELVLFARSPDGSVRWELRVIDRSDLGRPVVEIRLHGDDVAAFADVPDFFAALAAQPPHDLIAVRAIADALGAVDGTPRERPPFPPVNEAARRALGEVF